MKPGKIKKFSLLLKKHLFNHLPADNSHSQNTVLPSLYVGIWNFFDELSHRKHQLEITPAFDILIDNQKLPGSIQHIDTKELIFLDNYGYHLRIDATDYQPISLFDEADNRVYPINTVTLPESYDNKKNKLN
ncbi:hypothetical protein FD15_GL001612 [Liquorilactobacillus sucicola DSM 21376 = JCM 15457]|uniref:DUF4828 domain-containing protein n=1 Tax=Liquorilactobacillus sucicola DSM 21376 = JCM 15457 TaxID=1423806 RepID=A0A0R2DZP4_9LACO|nr:DUF4828 domain-containing protein [Liquorilactobacillus sucicola]KRN05805.1 hypothetical protein FD15_GL001612 [Liquorilactobacillus sucicola DSM 21376 = JCM 15457]